MQSWPDEIEKPRMNLPPILNDHDNSDDNYFPRQIYRRSQSNTQPFEIYNNGQQTQSYETKS